MSHGSSRPSRDDLAELYRKWRVEPGAVSPEWRDIFSRLDAGAQAWLEQTGRVAAMRAPSTAPPDGEQFARDSMAATALIRAYRFRGHLEADLDPLGVALREPHPDLAPETYGFGEGDLDRPVFIDNELRGVHTATVREILHALRRDYCGSVGVEFMHLQDPEQQAWIQERMEGSSHRTHLKDEGRRALLERLTAAETFESFLDRKYKGTKRFGLDGGEAALPALEQIVRRAVENGIDDITLGMAHRGRLNVLANLMGKPLAAMLAEFQGGASRPEEIGGAGDVKYHLGASADRVIDGREVHLSLAPNPSHLEAVNPIVCGKVRARQYQRRDHGYARCLGILIHGDAAFAGQGLVSETLQFCDIEGYRTGGTIHLIINNQIGFTTNPVATRSGPYCSDMAKAIQAPIFHVNGDDPEAVIQVAAAAVGFREAFKRDVVIDLFGYRRHGHNEADEPAFTQPLMYAKIKAHPTTRELYAARLIEEGVVSAREAAEMAAARDATLERAFEESTGYEPTKADWLEGEWSGLEPVRGFDARRGHTEVPLEVLKEVGAALVRVPEDFALNRKIQRQLAAKKKMFKSGEGFDWATAEALAFGTLLLEGHHVRLSGEDVNRGTFSHRHVSWRDQENETRHVPLNHIREHQERLRALDSPLSELGVAGFEYGFSMSAPTALVIWEAQFGDFANGAQIVIDQFLAAGESKWLRMSGLVMLLPHGYEGQGPEHSSARPERFLQLCAEDNLQVANCTTPANYFHVLRRQLHREFRKPLILMTPKSLLRHKRVASGLESMGPGSHFRRVLYCDTLPSPPQEARQVVLCTGKVYYDLLEARDRRGIRDVHFLRIEQLYPFPADALAELLGPYRHCHLVWCQEEPRNMGAWDYLDEFVLEVAESIGCRHPVPRYAGRETGASTATGTLATHLKEQAQLVDDALTVGIEWTGRLAHRREKRSAGEAYSRPARVELSPLLHG